MKRRANRRKRLREQGLSPLPHPFLMVEADPGRGLMRRNRILAAVLSVLLGAGLYLAAKALFS